MINFSLRSKVEGFNASVATEEKQHLVYVTFQTKSSGRKAATEIRCLYLKKRTPASNYSTSAKFKVQIVGDSVMEYNFRDKERSSKTTKKRKRKKLFRRFGDVAKKVTGKDGRPSEKEEERGTRLATFQMFVSISKARTEFEKKTENKPLERTQAFPRRSLCDLQRQKEKLKNHEKEEREEVVPKVRRCCRKGRQKIWETTEKGGGMWNKAYNVPEVCSDLKGTN
ncbi:hypothetical protein VNO80_22725 [Phaseolus coccineus]|uniref:Uncharacterized protein n=1 Tax=Phaseolus coccineus TaxID=3886 RepID=A0AAN9M4N0_PHACN